MNNLPLQSLVLLIGLFAFNCPGQETSGEIVGETSLESDGIQLFTRQFRVDSEVMIQKLKELGYSVEPAVQPLPNRIGGRVIPTTNDTSVLNISVRDYFRMAGVPLNRPKAVFFNDRNGLLLVRATLKDLERVDLALNALHQDGLQWISLEVHSMLLEQEAVEDLGLENMIKANKVQGKYWPEEKAGPALLTDAQFKVTRRAAEERLGSDHINLHQIKGLSGQRFLIDHLELKTLIHERREKLWKQINANELGFDNAEYFRDHSPFPKVETAYRGVLAYPKISAIVNRDNSSFEITLIAPVYRFTGPNLPWESGRSDNDKDLLDSTPTRMPPFGIQQYGATIEVPEGQVVLWPGLTIQDKLNRIPQSTLYLFIRPSLLEEGKN